MGIIVDAAQLPYLTIPELMNWLTMAASFLNLNEVEPKGPAQRSVAATVKAAVKEMDLLPKLVQKYEEKIRKQKQREQQNEAWQYWEKHRPAWSRENEWEWVNNSESSWGSSSNSEGSSWSTAGSSTHYAQRW